MGARADVPGEDPAESTGLSVLDLVKHASLTVIETMNENDRLGIVTFSSKSTVVQALTPMTKKNKDAARKNIKGLRCYDATNLWHGILDGVKVVKEGGDSSRVPAVLVLTDGMPNHMYVPSPGEIHHVLFKKKRPSADCRRNKGVLQRATSPS